MNTDKNCEHYTRRCSLLAPCCNKIYQCRLCHNEEEDHELDRSSVEFLVCSQCDVKQDVRSHCIKCGICFGMYSCLECRLFDDTDKQQFHCDDCGFCRIGGRENFIHCSNCEICLDKTFFTEHKCRAECGRDVCPVCYESVHSSTVGKVFVPNCGHLIHTFCLSMISKHNFVRCPICLQHYQHNNALFMSVNRIDVNDNNNDTNNNNL